MPGYRLQAKALRERDKSSDWGSVKICTIDCAQDLSKAPELYKAFFSLWERVHSNRQAVSCEKVELGHSKLMAEEFRMFLHHQNNFKKQTGAYG